ncbi:uncharacterized protein LOC131944310 [Physella acuta]|uniref:uncharacterized protein LOC131944310 n=1 Tax=Physella acuta TaxID=109671 RepID=UPI0027DB19C8|nr:uncharacterized protein LOC131944310 [Physella acuta]
MRETKEGRVELQGMTSETFAVVLNFIHQRVHGLTADNIDDIWEAANRLDIAIYLKEIEQFVIENLSIDNIWHFYLKAVNYNSNNVKDGSLIFMMKNYEHVFRMKEFLNLPFSSVLSCIEGDELNIKTEDSVLESILTWVSNGNNYKQGACMTRDCSEKKIACKDDGLQNSEGHSREVTISVGHICDSETVAEDGETATDKPGRKQGQHDDVKNEEQTGDVTKCSRIGDRASYLAKLMSSAKLTLATESYLRSLLTNPYIIQCPDAYHGVQEALNYKCGVYPLESATLTPLRASSGKRNALAFVKEDSCLHLYDLENRAFSKIKPENFKGRYRNIVSVASLGSKLCFICERYLRKCPFANHKCRLATVLLLNENKTLSTLYELCGQYNSLKTLFCVNNKFFCVKENDRYAATRSRIMNPDLLSTVVLNSERVFLSSCAFENDILMIIFEGFVTNQPNELLVHTYNLETKSLTATKIPNVGRLDFIAVAIHKDKDTFLLLSSGVLLSIKGGSDNAIKFNPVVHLWTNINLMLNGAVCYKNELTLFCIASRVPNWTILSSVPGLFEKISVVEPTEEMWTTNMVPVIAPLSWFV